MQDTDGTTAPPLNSSNDKPTGTKPEGFGPNVLIFDPSMPMADIQNKLDKVFKAQEQNQFGTERFAYFFKPGQYSVDVKVGFYTQVLGLGASPDSTVITGAIRVTADWFKGNGTQNFWRGAENIAVIPTLDNRVNVWAVSQATALRRFHVKGSTNLWDAKYDPAWTSGGFMADSLVDDKIISGSQQQFLTRNSSFNRWDGGVWNMVFVGDANAPAPNWPDLPHTVIAKTPSIREKPYIVMDSAGKYSVAVPVQKVDSSGISWGPGAPATPTLPIEKFYIAHAGYDTAGSINDALASGKHLIMTPGVYHIQNSIHISKPGTIVLGLGIATVIPDRGTEAFVIDDVDDVTLTGLLFDAGPKESETLLRVGATKTNKSHIGHPIALSDLSCRVGGVVAGLAKSCVILNANNTFIDNVWLWRADHGNGVGWDVNKAINGIIVNGDSVQAYGLFVEHFEEYQTLWNGENGLIYFYQSEIPYDVPSQNRWTHANVNGWASLKVSDKVTKMDAQGLGVYCFFDNPALLENAIETPSAAGIKMSHIVTKWLGTAKGSGITHIMNGSGKSVLWVPNGIDSASSPY
ncbi:MAG: adenylyl cyclase [Oligoflexus sp.]|nr:adenylyl cyclase [Oligoflexus sp.]